MERYRRIGLSILLALILTSTLVACSGFSLAGGIGGGVLTLLAIVFWFATAATQTSCSVQSCLSLVSDVGPEPDVGPCLSQVLDVGPCLSDAGAFPDADVGDDGGPIGPCLSQLPPDAEVDDDAGAPDALPDVASLQGSSNPALARGQAIERLAQKGVLPADLVARLKGKTKGDA